MEEKAKQPLPQVRRNQPLIIQPMHDTDAEASAKPPRGPVDRKKPVPKTPPSKK